MFNGAGYRAVAISGTSDQTDRDAALVDLAAGRIDVVVNCQLWVAGVDCPAVSCIILLAPTKSVTKYLQSVGRGLRLHPGKTDCIVLDHAGNALNHGLPTEPREWSLDGAKRNKRNADAVEAVKQCERCYFVFKPQAECPNCGHVHIPKPKVVAQTDGELAEITSIKRERRAEVGKARSIEDLKRIAEERGYKIGWVYQQLRIKGAKVLGL
jgi:superfamily II DNA or RNA helicase